MHCVTTYTSKLKLKYFIPTTLTFPSALLCLQFFDTSCHIYKYSLRWQPRLTTSAKKKQRKWQNATCWQETILRLLLKIHMFFILKKNACVDFWTEMTLLVSHNVCLTNTKLPTRRLDWGGGGYFHIYHTFWIIKLLVYKANWKLKKYDTHAREIKCRALID